MILPMLRFELIVHQNDYQRLLENLSALRLAHLLNSESPLPELLSKKWSQLKHWEILVQRLETILPSVPQLDSEQMVTFDQLTHLFERLDLLTVEIKQLEQQLKNWDKWGAYPYQQAKILEQAGVFLRIFTVNPKNFKGLMPETAFVVYRSDDEMGVVTFCDEDFVLPNGWHELDSGDFKQLTAEKSKLNDEILAIQEELKQYTSSVDSLKKACSALDEELRWADTRHHTHWVAEEKLGLLTFFVPNEKANQFREVLIQGDYWWRESTPLPGEKVPVKLKNTRLASLFEPIGDLFSMPAYHELDLTPFFAPFFTLFFGMCVSDIGYGIFLIALLLLIRNKPALSAYKSLNSLGILFGGAAVVVGLFTGTFFGISLADVEWQWLKAHNVSFVSVDDLFSYSLYIGIFQIVFGMILRMVNRIRQFGWLYGLSTLGWLIMLFGGTGMYFLPNVLFFELVLYLGIGMLLLFSDPTKGFFGRLGIGIWELYGITGLFGDVMSYVRLFALGLSGGILGFVVNDIAMSSIQSGGFGSIGGVLILLIGHTLNFAIALLSATVHPIRLTFVEFYKNAGFTGGGIPFKTFELTNKTK